MSQNYMNAIMESIKYKAKADALVKGAFTINNIIKSLETMTKDKEVKIILKVKDENDNVSVEEVGSDMICYSWRGSYDLPATEYGDTFYTVSECLKNLKQADGRVEIGYKGGEFTLSANDILYLANYSQSNNSTAIVDVQEEDDYVRVITEIEMY